MNLEKIETTTQITNDEQFNFDEHEKQEFVESIERKQRMIWFGEKHLSFKKRLYQFIATFVIVVLRNFTGKLSWQFGLVFYLAIVCPIGTFVSIKWLINLFS